MRNMNSKRHSDEVVDFLFEVGYQVNRARMKKRMTQEQLAKAVGIARTSITLMESGQKDTPLSQLYQVAKVLQVDIKTLFER